MYIATADSSPTNHGTIKLGPVQKFTYLYFSAPCIAFGFPLTAAVDATALADLLQAFSTLSLPS